MKIEHTPDLSAGFFRAWLDMAERIDIDPMHGLMVSHSESGVYATAHNKHGNASGLIQFMPQTLLGLGWSSGHAEFRKLNAEQQVVWVERYWGQYRAHGLDSPARIYLSTFLPAYLTNKESRKGSFVLCAARGPMAWAYLANQVFDRDKKGYITVSDLGLAIERNSVGKRWNEIARRLEDAVSMDVPEIEVAEPRDESKPDSSKTIVVPIAWRMPVEAMEDAIATRDDDDDEEGQGSA